MKVNGIPVVKLTKPGDCLGGALSRCTNYVAKHNNIPFDVVLLAGTNDLSKREVKPEDLIENLDKSLTELKRFQNVNEIFLCKIPPGCDYVSINTKVKLYNQFLFERFFATEEFITVIESIPHKIRFFYQDGLHMSDLGLTKLCSTILSKLYKVLFPSSQNKRNRFLRRQSRQQGDAASSFALSLGCCNLQYFKTAQLYFKAWFPLSQLRPQQRPISSQNKAISVKDGC